MTATLLAERPTFIDLVRAEAARHVHEIPSGSNRNPYAKIAGHANGEPWCLTFLCACGITSGLGGVPNSASTLYAIDWAIRHGLWHRGITGVRPGDWIFRLRHGGGHCGTIIKAPFLGIMTTVEANTTRGGAVSWNGGEVVEQRRNVAAWRCVGYIRPTGPIGPGAPIPVPTPVPVPVPTPTGAKDMLHLVKIKGKPEWYATDFLTRKAYIATPAMAAQLAKIGVLHTATNGQPFEVTDPATIALLVRLPQV